MIKRLEKISTGSYDLNKWIYGGYERGIITMIVGPPGSGKTNFVLLAAASQAKKEKKVLFIDSEGGFSPDRIKQIGKEDYEKILKNIFLIEIRNFEEQKETIKSLEKQLQKNEFDLIVIDSMAMLYRLELAQASYEEKDKEKVKRINKDIVEQMKILSEIARREKIAILITNQVYQDFLSKEEIEKGVEKETYIVGGDLFQYWSKCIIELKNEKGKRKAFLLKHRSLPQKEISFEIKNEGIIKRGWV
jgi:DNA repair protein RadB